MLVFTTDKERLLRHFEKDRVLFAYHIGDLDQFYFPNCQWYVDYGERARIEECLLLYTGLETPTVLAFGISDRYPPFLEEVVSLLPFKFYCHYFEKDREIFIREYDETDLGLFWKMKLDRFRAPEKSDTVDTGKIVRMNVTHSELLQKLYDEAYPGNYFDEKMLATGKYYGYFDGDNIVSVTGVHVDSREYTIAVLGNITTLPSYRGKGLAQALTAHLVEELIKEGKEVCLNVKGDNEPAIKAYEALGFKKTHEYREALFELRK